MGTKLLPPQFCFWLLSLWGASESDPELTSDLAVPPGVNASSLEGNFFTSALLPKVPANSGDFATVTQVDLGIFRALKDSESRLHFSNSAPPPPPTVNVPHTHPRGTEVLFIIEGTLDVGLFDTTNKLFTQTLNEGYLFVFPKGLVHSQINWGSNPKSVRALAAFSSSNPGLVRLPNTLFKSGISEDILAQSLGYSAGVVLSSI